MTRIGPTGAGSGADSLADLRADALAIPAALFVRSRCAEQWSAAAAAGPDPYWQVSIPPASTTLVEAADEHWVDFHH